MITSDEMSDSYNLMYDRINYTRTKLSKKDHKRIFPKRPLISSKVMTGRVMFANCETWSSA